MRYVENTSVVLVFLGDGLLLRKLHKLAKKTEGRVYFHPAVPQHELIELTASADVGVIPYQATCLNNFYCTPNKLFEFIAAGLPILATDLPELRKFVELQDIGMVGDTSTPQELARLIDSFFEDSTRLTFWGERVLEVREVINWESEEKKLIEIYEAFR